MEEQKPNGNQIENQTRDLAKVQIRKQTEEYTGSQKQKHTENHKEEASVEQGYTAREWIKNHIDTKQVLSLIVAVVAAFLGGLMVAAIVGEVRYKRFYSKPYITFESDNMQVFHLSKEVPTLEYSVGEKKWQTLKTQNVVFGGEHGKLLLRGNSELGTSGATVLFSTDAEVVCVGDIRTLVDYNNYNNTTTSKASFEHLFNNCKQLVIAPELPPKRMAEGCYYGMFAGCTSLKAAPELPAEKLCYSCYSEMFSGCTSLEYAPKLPAKELAEWCYAYMFSNCTSLKEGPELPAMDLANGCYKNMFSDCVSLKAAPELPAQNLSPWCYANMFFNCVSMEKAPELPSKCLVDNCYSNMFSGCTSVTQITMSATSSDAAYLLDNWIEGISPKGTFRKNKDAQWQNEGVVPDGWEVVLVELH